MLNRRVRLKPSYARWHLEHPDIYVDGSGQIDKCYETETILHLMCCLGVPICGRVIGRNEDCYHIIFKASGLKMDCWVEKRQVFWG